VPTPLSPSRAREGGAPGPPPAARAELWSEQGAGEDADNVYLREFRRCRFGSPSAARDFFDWLRTPTGSSAFEERVRCVRRYAFAVPNAAALSTLARHAPIVELGAGTGYWAYLLRRRGVEIAAFDVAPPDRAANPYKFEPRTWTTVAQGGVERLAAYPDRALFLCWPGQRDPFADAALAAYHGPTLLYVGEGPGGHTADERFFARLERDWRPLETIRLPNWPGTRDSLTVLQRIAVVGHGNNATPV
jgi:hypothetical protein